MNSKLKVLQVVELKCLIQPSCIGHALSRLLCTLGWEEPHQERMLGMRELYQRIRVLVGSADGSCSH